MNYAWANPTTGIREQASTLEEAKYLAWAELQVIPLGSLPSTVICEQERVGTVAKGTRTLDIEKPWDGGYAWANPRDGKRKMAATWYGAVEQIQHAFADLGEGVSVESVSVYRQRQACVVCFDDPEPGPPAPVVIPPDTPQSLIEEVMDGSCADPGRAQLLAMLWIAGSLQEVAGALHYMSPGPPERTRLGIWQRFKVWLFGHSVYEARTCELCGGPTADSDTPICPDCAKVALRKDEELKSETPKEADARRTRLVNERSLVGIIRGVKADPTKPHVYWFPQDGNSLSCGVYGCGKPLNHAIHGYTGD